jgi:3-dehydroquinate synthase
MRSRLKIALYVGLVIAVVSLPFVIFGEGFALPLLSSHETQRGWLVLIAILLLAADSVAPVPSVLVVVFVAAKGGWLAGFLGGTLGLSAGVACAGWFGQVAMGRIAPQFFPDAELTRLRESLQKKLVLTLACMRSVPVLAETSVMIATSLGVSVRRVFVVTLLPNAAIAAIYSLAADDSFRTACVAFFATVLPSALIWCLWGRGRGARAAGSV